MGARRIRMEKKEVKENMTNKLPWIAATIIIVAAIGAWVVFGGAPATPPGTATITGIAGTGTVFAAGIPPANESGIENVYIITPGYTETENLSGHANIIGVIESDTDSCDIDYETTFHIVVAVKAGSDNMAYVTVENMNVGLAITGSFTASDENAGDSSLSHMAASPHENSGYSSGTGWLRINAIWDNNGTGYVLHAGDSITLENIRLWGWG